MIKVTVMYPNTPGGRFDMAYYCNSHMPLVQKKVGAALKGMAVDQGISGEEPGSPPTYVAVGHLLFESVEAFHAAFGPQAEVILADIPKYTNIEPVFQISEVKM